ncbi:putative UDP-rhamnose:rhamnosyltransferase 1 [Dichanthelium oligosanthes]|uniref:Glycosyltransferase n=1 Tax=Dichanthelium oligosanthes TaxID=888268 RepID=A0A1E5VAZ2_9POAL|nr:putative UDP-rhamnose:rhamnosyltransferase 1 [Dichanthelium oligosanthes]
MAEIQETSSPLHIVVFPWLAFGHMIPFLELSKRLARRGHAVTFVSTPRNAARLGAVPPELTARVRVVTLELPAVEGLPDGAESMADVAPEKVELLKKAFDSLAAPFAALVGEGCASHTGGDGEADGFERKTDWIILDFAQNWVWPIAEEHKIPCAMFLILPAALLAYIGTKHDNEAHPRRTTEDCMAQPPWVPFPSTLSYRRHEAEAIAAGFRPNASGVSDIDRLLQLVHHPSCRLIVHRSCPEAEPWLFPLLTDLFAKPVVPAGLLLPGDVVDDEDGHAPGGGHEPFAAAVRWLDEQPRRSVIYVALGSEAPVTPAHIRDLAVGLELSGARFLWAIRPQSGDHSAGALLPDGFERRVAGRGVVRAGWVPQVRVLAHAAMGAFLTHCGWGSTMESLFRFGHPLVMLPFVADQGLIARAMAARGVGVEVPRDDADRSFRGADVAAAVRRVMMEEEGEALARNAREMQEVVGDRVRQELYVDELVFLQRYK